MNPKYYLDPKVAERLRVPNHRESSFNGIIQELVDVNNKISFLNSTYKKDQILLEGEALIKHIIQLEEKESFLDNTQPYNY